MSRILLTLLLLTSGWVMANDPTPIDAPYNKVFDPWHACMEAEALAKRGAPDALRTLFLAAYVRVSQPFLGGEDIETMSMIFDRVFAAVGDAKFSHALDLQRPEIRSAVGSFLGQPLGFAKKSPKTAKLLREAPKIDWPLDKAVRDDR